MESDLNFEKLKLIVLKSPFQYWENKLVREWFCKMIALKKVGYGACYGNKVLPVDTTDFFATHVILALKARNGEYLPIMGYKITSLKQSNFFNLAFPGLLLVRAAKSEEHVIEIEKMIQRCEKNDIELSYLGSWTIDPSFKKNTFFDQNFIREIFSYLYSKVFISLAAQEVVIGGTLRFKTEELFARLGHEPLKNKNGILPPILVQHLAREPVLVMHSKAVPEVTSKLELKWQRLWLERAELGDTSQTKLLKLIS